MTEPTPCPCGSGKPYSDCCEPLISGARAAATPESLMRSRYTAFATQQVAYLEHSLHPGQRSDYDAAGTAKWAANSSWEGLEILDISGDPEADSIGKVEFRAHYRRKGERIDHHELAEFRKHNGVWYFYDGRMVTGGQVRRDTPKVGRNDPCPCGSGKKYKKCCGQS